MASLEASAKDFVVKAGPDALEVLRAALEGQGQAEILREPDLYLVKIRHPHPSPKFLWQEILDRIPNAEWVAPVLLDQDTASYPTGDISVRFVRPLSAQDLQDFASAHQLRIEKKNQFIAEQVSFRPLTLRNTYLPELLEHLAADKNVARAWANTMSHYQRLP